MSAAFDTLSVARDLEAAGIERAHAEAIAKIVHHGDERAATKADLEQLRAATQTDLDRLRAATQTDLEQLRAALRAATKADLDTAITALRAEFKADIALLRADLDTATTRLTARMDGMRSELGTIRWAIGLLAAFNFAIGLRVFGLF